MARASEAWHLTSSALGLLMAKLDADPAIAGQKYEHLRRALQKFFAWQGDLDPDHAADETLDRVARRLDRGASIDDVPSFTHGVARMVRLERQRRRAQHPTVNDEGVVDQMAAPQRSPEDSTSACVQHCLSGLAEEDRALILRYYTGERREKIEGRTRLARELGLSENALRHRVQRLRERVKVCARDCVARHEPADFDSTHQRRPQTTPERGRQS
jgi:DNA-directed RNA polymerase specialized sigma24 family protein